MAQNREKKDLGGEIHILPSSKHFFKKMATKHKTSITWNEEDCEELLLNYRAITNFYILMTTITTCNRLNYFSGFLTITDCNTLIHNRAVKQLLSTSHVSLWSRKSDG